VQSLLCHSPLTTAFAIAVEGGLLLGAAFIYSRNLWFPIAIHFAWNFTQTGIFGAITLGNVLPESLLTSTLSGNALISEGVFGPEGSIQAFVFCLIASILLLVLSHRQNKITVPYWTKQKQIQDHLIPIIHLIENKMTKESYYFNMRDFVYFFFQVWRYDIFGHNSFDYLSKSKRLLLCKMHTF
jgi:hypothetical protein